MAAQATVPATGQQKQQQQRPDSVESAVVVGDDTSVATVGRAAGVAAANGRSVVLRGVVSFAAGLPLGFAGVFALAEPQAATLLLAGVGGGVVLAAADAGPRRVPAALLAAATARGPSYADAYRAGFRTQLQVRRRHAVAVGGGTGALLGAGLAAYLVYALGGT